MIAGKRIKVFVDNKAVYFGWLQQKSRSADLNIIMKEIFQLTLQLNFSLEMTFVPSSLNPSDIPSRSLSKSDATLTLRTWLYVQFLFGEHNIDVFSLDSNAMKSLAGEQFKHFTPFPTPLSSGIDAFAQTYSDNERCYTSPPFCLLPGFIKFIVQEAINVTLVFPLFDLVEPWYVMIMKYARCIIPVGYKHDKGVLLYPTKKGYQKDKLGLPWTLLAADFNFLTREQPHTK